MYILLLFIIFKLGIGYCFEREGECIKTAWDVNICGGVRKIQIGFPDLIIVDGGEDEVIKGSPRVVICRKAPCRTKAPGKLLLL